MRCAYLLEPGDVVGATWAPRMVWDDGLVTRAATRIPVTESFGDALSEVGRWNWALGVSHDDAVNIVAASRTLNATLTVSEVLHHGS